MWFSRREMGTIGEALIEHGRTHDVRGRGRQEFGPRYVVEGKLSTPVAGVRTCVAYGMDKGAVAPRLITAYLWRTHENQRA